jgi:hypothetical protein
MQELFWIKRTFKNDVEDDTSDTIEIRADSPQEAIEQATRGHQNVTAEIVSHSKKAQD